MRFILALILASTLATVTGCKHTLARLNGFTLGQASSQLSEAISKSNPEMRTKLEGCKTTVSEECRFAQSLANDTYSGVVSCGKKAETFPPCDHFQPFGDAGVFGTLIFKNGKLVSIQAKTPDTFDPAVTQLSAMYGRPTITTSDRALSAVWETKTFRLSVNGFKDDPSRVPTVYITMQTPGHYAVAREQQEKSQKEHDSELYGLLKTAKEHVDNQARLDADIAAHKSDAVINSDKWLIKFIDHLNMDEIFLANEVRDDEAVTAVR